MKLKDVILSENLPQSQIYRTYNDFIEDADIPENSIEFDEDGRIVSDQLSVLNFIQFLLKEYEYLPEKKHNKTLGNEDNPNKKKSKKLKNLKRIKRFKMNNYPLNTGNNLDYHRTIGNTPDFNNTPYYNQPFSSSGSSFSQNIPIDPNNESSIS